jgi:hypothetical protein
MREIHEHAVCRRWKRAIVKVSLPRRAMPGQMKNVRQRMGWGDDRRKSVDAGGQQLDKVVRVVHVFARGTVRHERRAAGAVPRAFCGFRSPFP